MKRLLIIYVQLLVTIFFSIRSVAQLNNQDDYEALRSLYLTTDGDNWTNNTGWPNAATFTTNTTVPSGTDMSSWFGITVAASNDKRVGTVHLPSNNLKGNIPDLSGLYWLSILRLQNNELNGNVPTTLGNLGNLVSLALGRNQLSGNIPAELGNLSKLKSLLLNSNNLVGQIPSEIGNLLSLSYLDLAFNELSGTIPVTLGNARALSGLYISNNQISGAIPSSLGNLTNLRFFRAHYNQISGTIPSSLGNLTNLEELRLTRNQITGRLPVSLVNLIRLTSFSVSDNQLSGCYDEALKQGGSVLCNFRNVNISNGNNFDSDWENFCTSNAGTCVTSCTHPDFEPLASLYKSTNGDNWVNNNNWFSNCDPCSWQGIYCNANDRVVIISLANNNLRGEIPTQIGSLEYLTELYLFGNAINGEIPRSLGNLSNLTSLYLRENRLNGTIPSEIGSLTLLKELDLSQNNLEDSMPSSFADLINLTVFNIANNDLSGCYASVLKEGSSVLCNFSNSHITNGNNFDATWEDFCTSNEGTCSSLGIDDLGVKNTVTVYPNPTKDFIKIKGGDIEKVTIYNNLGVKIKELNTSDNHFKIEELPVGVYMVQLINKDRKKQVVKLLKN